MATDRQKEAARRNLEKARKVQSARAHGARVPRARGLSTASQNRLSNSDFAFPKERKEPWSTPDTSATPWPLRPGRGRDRPGA